MSLLLITSLSLSLGSCVREVIQEVPSPSGHAIARVVRYNGGATTDFLYKVYLDRPNQLRHDLVWEAYRLPPILRWTSDVALTVEVRVKPELAHYTRMIKKYEAGDVAVTTEIVREPPYPRTLPFREP